MPMSVTLPLPRPHAIGESDGRENFLPKIKAPFVLTSMNHAGKPLLMWVREYIGERKCGLLFASTCCS